jgi:phage tail-like protein
MSTVTYPFTAFSFAVEIYVGEEAKFLVEAAFSECDGLEMTHEIKSIREGGANDRQIRLNGPVSYGNLTLKRGVTGDFALWDWFRKSIANPRLRAGAEVVLLAPGGVVDKSGVVKHDERARFQLSRCVPVKLKAPQLNARDGQIAVEELQLAYETLQLALPSA